MPKNQDLRKILKQKFNNDSFNVYNSIPSQEDLNYIVDEKTLESTPYLTAIFKNIGASAVKKAALKTLQPQSVRLRRKRAETNFKLFRRRFIKHSENGSQNCCLSDN